METKFTPGPWNVDPDYPGDIQAGGAEIATAFDTHDAVTTTADADTAIANAHLIAAAPDLYAALERVLRWQPNDSASDLVAVAEAALSRARGES